MSNKIRLDYKIINLLNLNVYIFIEKYNLIYQLTRNGPVTKKNLK